VNTGALLGSANTRPGSCGCGDPVSVGSGNLFEQFNDYETSGFNTLGFTRYYNSGANPRTFAVALGPNWRSTYDRHVRIISPSSVTVERADGEALSFALTGGVWQTSTDIDTKLTNTGSTWIFTDSDDTIETYVAIGSSQALLKSVQARNGYTQTLQYDAANDLLAVTDSFGRTLQFSYQNGILQKLTTPDGLVVSYGYSSSPGRLASVSYSTTPQTSQSYLYENAALPFALTGVIDEKGNRFATWTYDSQGRVLSSQHAGGADLTAIVYNDSDGSRTVTNALGVQSLYKFTTLQGVPKVTEIDRLATASTGAAKRTVTYDSSGYTASQTDWSGNVTNYVNDAHGQPTSITEAAGTSQARTTTITYHSQFHLPLSVVTSGLTTTFSYDSSGNLLGRTETDTTASSVPFATNGTARTWTFTWSNGLLISTQGPRTDAAEVTKLTYDSTGALTASFNALGQKTSITQHTPGGFPQTVIDPNGVQTQLAYDARLRLLSRTVTTAAGKLTTSYAYDANGDLLTTTLPDGSALTNSYDAAHRLTGITDLLGQNIAYTLDALGNTTLLNVLNSGKKVQRTRSGSFDALGERLADIGGVGQKTALTYDANGNALTITDPLGRVTKQVFDALNRRTKVTDPAGGVTSVAYDAHDRPLSVTDPNGAVTSYIYDGFGDLIQKSSPDTGITVYHYDPAGNLVQRLDAAGIITNYAYDALDRVVSIAYPGNPAENATLVYDESGYGFTIGRLTTVFDPAGTLHRTYDERGNILNETRSR
jgi:YD repeat-containing protein